MIRSFAALILAVQLFAPARGLGAQATRSAPVRVVSQLYKDFAWEATGGDDGPGGRPFVDQPRTVLLRYLTSDLADLLLRDRACVRRSSEICRLDFVPLWASQDPDAADVSFAQLTRQPAIVIAHIRDHAGTVTKITYRLKQTAAGWRIADIQYSSGHTLRGLLDE